MLLLLLTAIGVLWGIRALFRLFGGVNIIWNNGAEGGSVPDLLSGSPFDPNLCGGSSERAACLYPFSDEALLNTIELFADETLLGRMNRQSALYRAARSERENCHFITPQHMLQRDLCQQDGSFIYENIKVRTHFKIRRTSCGGGLVGGADRYTLEPGYSLQETRTGVPYVYVNGRAVTPEETVCLEHNDKIAVGLPNNTIFTFGTPGNMEPPPLLKQNYEIAGMISKGTFGLVYLGKSRRSNLKDVALKVVFGSELDRRNLSAGKIFSNETTPLLSAKNANILGIYETQYYKGNLWMALELCGTTLAKKLVDNSGWVAEDEDLFAAYLHQALNGLNCLTCMGVMHRDIKPENLLILDARPRLSVLKLSDFGTSRLIISSGAVTEMGTDNYKAPEIRNGDRILQSRPCQADVYSLGCVAVFMATRGSLADLQDNAQTWNVLASTARTLVQAMLNANPLNRPTPEMAMASSYFKETCPAGLMATIRHLEMGPVATKFKKDMNPPEASFPP